MIQMDEKFVALFHKHYSSFPSSWSEEEKTREIAQYALESIADLPELDMGDGVGVPQREFDRLVEDAFEFYRGEALHLIRNAL